MGTERRTLLDIARETDPKGRPAQIIEVLNQTNPILQDMPAFPSNAPMGNTVTMRTGLPTVAFTKINQGSTRSKSASEKRVDTMGILDGLSEVDSKMRAVIGAARFDAHRRKEDDSFVEAMAQTAALTLFYGNEKTNEASFTGLAPRLNTLASVATGSQVWDSDAAGTGGDLTSIYVVDMGEKGAHLIYPEGSTAGMTSGDKGEVRVTDIDGNPMMAYVSSFLWTLGLSIEDPRHIGRLANIDVSTALADTGLALGMDLIDVLTSMPDQGGMTRVAYCAKRIVAAFYKQAINKSNASLTIRDYLGKPTPYFWDVPLRACDQISLTESQVS